ncbi:MAG: ATP-binding protein [Tissierellaceae bacterium]|nr:ATP-binding protein [Tissierellaceae bacterium]
MDEHGRDIKGDVNLLANTMQSINKAKDFQLVSDFIFKFIQNFVSFNMIVIYKYNERESSLDVVSCIGSSTEKMKNRIPFRIGEGAIGLVAKDKKSLLINDALNSKEIKVRQFHEEDPLIRSFMAIPLVVGDKIIGILSVSCSKPHQYTQYDMQMISIIASQGSAFLELNEYISDIEKMSNQILENVNSGVMVIDCDFNVLVFNNAAEKITGYSEDEVIGRRLIDIPLKEHDNHWFIINSIKEMKVFNEEKTYMIRKSGEFINIRLSTSVLYDEDNSVKTCICIFRDVTELEELQRQVILADKLSALGRITAGITHEIRNPLLPIRNASEYLLRKFKDDDKNTDTVKLLNIIIEESERLNRFLGQLSNLSKDNIVTSGACNFDIVLDNILALLRYNIKSNDINIKINIENRKIILPCNEDNLRQVLLNILLNAIDSFNMDYNNEKKEIRINGNLQDKDFYLEIEDTGKGISKKDLNNIFEPFYTTKDDGTGLGLPLSLNIINSIGGKITINSTLGVGTRVSIRIPTESERVS